MTSSFWETVDIHVWKNPISVMEPYKLPLQIWVQEQFNRHHSRACSVVKHKFGMMKARWRATLFNVLEVSPVFAPDIFACYAFLHKFYLKTNYQQPWWRSPGSSPWCTRRTANNWESHQRQDGSFCCLPLPSFHSTCRSMTTFEHLNICSCSWFPLVAALPLSL